MSLIKMIQDKDFASLKQYTNERISNIITNRVATEKNTFLSNLRGSQKRESDSK